MDDEITQALENVFRRGLRPLPGRRFMRRVGFGGRPEEECARAAARR